jgi:hypothetical protein
MDTADDDLPTDEESSIAKYSAKVIKSILL